MPASTEISKLVALYIMLINKHVRLHRWRESGGQAIYFHMRVILFHVFVFSHSCLYLFSYVQAAELPSSSDQPSPALKIVCFMHKKKHIVLCKRTSSYSYQKANILNNNINLYA